jgi:SAM-dependent methyltransferase
LLKNEDPVLQVDWPNIDDTLKRYRVMLDVINFNPPIHGHKIKLLDFGCGLSGLYKYLLETGREGEFDYVGLDIVPEFIKKSQVDFPDNEYLVLDIMQNDLNIGNVDFAILNGMFTQKISMTDGEMFDWMKILIEKIFDQVTYGMAFNFMSPFVDYQKGHAFHLQLDRISEYIASSITRRFIIRHDYLPFEATVFIYPQDGR